MKIQAGKYFVNTDSNNNTWITELVLNAKTGKEYEKRVSGYYGDLKSALANMLKRCVYGSDTTNLTETIDTIENTLNDAVSIIKNM